MLREDTDGKLQIGVCRSDGTEPLTSCDDSPTRFAGGLPAGRSQRGSARHWRPFTTALPLRYPSGREPLSQPRGNSLPDKWFLPALFRLPPGGSSRPQAGEGIRVHNGFHFLRLSDSPKETNLPTHNNPLTPQTRAWTGTDLPYQAAAPPRSCPYSRGAPPLGWPRGEPLPRKSPPEYPRGEPTAAPRHRPPPR